MNLSRFVGVFMIVAGLPSVVRGGGFDLSAVDLYKGAAPTGGLSLLSEDRLEALASPGPAPAASLTSSVGSMSLGADGDDGPLGSYMSAKLGPLWFTGDLEDLDVGLNAELAFGFRIIRILAIEFQSGYFWGEDDSVDAELWGVPFVVNAKLIIPILILELYGGLGIGGYYINTEVDVGAASVEDDDFVFGGNAFLGVGLALGRFAFGLEGKYILTEDFDAPGGGNDNLEGFAAMAYFTLYF